MSVLSSLHEEISEVQQAMSENEKLLLEHPEKNSVRLSLKSLEKRQAHLEKLFMLESNKLGYDICTYRLFSVGEIDNTRNMFVVPVILSDFQDVYTLVYHALEHGSKKTSKVSDQTRRMSAFEFGYSCAGSLSVIFTVKRDDLLFDEFQKRRLAIDSVFDVLQARDRQDIQEVSSRFGIPVVRSVYNLAKHHVDNHVGADIDWREGSSILIDKIFQPREFERLINIIAEISEEKTETIDVSGLLLMADVRRHKFEIRTDDGALFRGDFLEAIDESHTVELPRRYNAVIKITTVTKYATLETTESYFLEDLSGPLA